MDLSELDGTLDWETASEAHFELKKALPNLHFSDYLPTRGVAKGYDFPAETDAFLAVAAYCNHRIAVIRGDHPKKETLVEPLQKIGYHVPSHGFAIKNLVDDPIILPEEVLWEELKKGNRKKIIRSQLESLLTPILTSLRNVQDVHFGVYDPSYFDEPSDDIDPSLIGYIPVGKLFSLPAAGNGLVNLDLLVEEICTMPNHHALAIASTVKTPSGKGHIPMIDFSSAWGEFDSYWMAEEVLERMRFPGRILVASGNSYHHHDTSRIITSDQFHENLRFLAEQPEVGPYWPRFQELQGFSLLRISPCTDKLYFPNVEMGE